jgi:serine/threonine-protein kinase
METAPVTGMLVGSNVRLLYLLGTGGMGAVWVAEHLLLQIDVAVKFLAPELVSVPEARARFEREAAAAAQLKNRHVVQIFDRGVTDQGLPYIVMELLMGQDLGKYIERSGPRPLEQVVTIITQMARALTAAHAQGIVHRDIKPENVLLIDPDGDLFAKLLDFGIAKHTLDTAWDVTSTNITMGTPHFMSPEQLMSPKDVDFHADLWSVAVVAYIALTGTPPFDGATIGSLCVAVNSGSFQPVTRLRRDLPASIDSWFQRAFQRDSAQRFGSIQEMALALQAASGANQLGLGSNNHPTPVSSGGSYRAFSSLQTPAAGQDQGFEASVTRREPSSGSRIWMALAVIAASMVSSAATTLLFLGPESFQVFGAIARDALGGAEEPSGPSGAAAEPPVSGSEITQSPTVEPVLDPAPFPGTEAVEIQANKPDGADHPAPRGSSLAAPARGGRAASNVAAPVPASRATAPAAGDGSRSEQQANDDAWQPALGDEHVLEPASNEQGPADDGPDYGF